MRRALLVLVVLALPVWCATMGTGPAGAHTCGSPVVVDVGERATVPIGVAAEQVAVTGIDIEVPRGFRLARVRIEPGWSARTTGAVVEVRGGTVEPYGCATVGLEGTATTSRELTFRVTTTAADGTSAEATRSAFAVTRERPFPLGTVLGVGLVTLGLAGGAVAFLRRRRVSRDGEQPRARPTP